MEPIKERILAAYKSLPPVNIAGGGRDYLALLYAVFPESEYPRAFRSPTRGGPPGCVMAFSRAVREMGGRRTWNPHTILLPAALVREHT